MEIDNNRNMIRRLDYESLLRTPRVAMRRPRATYARSIKCPCVKNLYTRGHVKVVHCACHCESGVNTCLRVFRQYDSRKSFQDFRLFVESKPLRRRAIGFDI